MSFQLANEVIKTEEELAEHRHNLEVRVGERTAELQNTNNNLEREIDERQKVASALRRSERTARALLNAPSDTAMLVEPDGEILDTNLVGASRLGLSVAEALGKNAFDLMGPDVSALRKAKAEELIATRQPVRWEDEHGGRYYDNNLYPIMDDSGEVASIAVFATDITDYVRAQQQEKEAAAIQERNRLARDLHDAVTQTVYSASLIAEALPQVWKRNPDEGMRNLFKLRQLVRGALGEMRTLLFELRPSALQAAELNTLLRQLADVLTGRTRIPVELILEGDTQPPSEVKIVLYRITQEAFNNITKHSNATQVQVTLQSDLEQLTLAIRDNGIGFDPQAVTAESMGLRIMRERAESVDVLVEVQSASGNGTQVTVIWTGGSPAAQDASAPPLSE
jgi:PAS domain S-box-containing protein